MPDKGKLLIIEDDPGIQDQLKWCFDQYEVLVAGTRESAITELRRHEPAVVTLDMGLPPDPGGTSEGLKALDEILSLAPDTKVIVVTGNDDRDSAVKAIGAGAYDFYLKPIDADILGLIVNRAYRVRELEQENRRLSAGMGQNSALGGLITNSPAMHKIVRTVEKIAPTDVTTLLLGESGTGKEVVARSIHSLSARSEGPFIAINCAAIPENLLESELFGHEKGAFTGAVSQNRGKFEMAHSGTLFLDEIGDLPKPLQAKLLRFLQERVIERVGGRKEIAVDTRVICATHQKLQEMIQSGDFREDLYYRLSEIIINIPPLKERDGDSVLLARYFMERFATEHSRKIRGLTQNALLAIEQYNWPGNIRELENRMKRAVIMADENGMITEEDLELSQTEADQQPFNLRQVRQEAEKKAILRALQHVNGNMAKSAALLGVSRPTLYDLINKYDIET